MSWPVISRMSLAADWGSAVAPEESEFGIAVCSALTFSCVGLWLMGNTYRYASVRQWSTSTR